MNDNRRPRPPEPWYARVYMAGVVVTFMWLSTRPMPAGAAMGSAGEIVVAFCRACIWPFYWGVVAVPGWT